MRPGRLLPLLLATLTVAAASFDSGATFTQLGAPPAAALFEWRMEPHLAADPGRNRTWLCGSVSDGVATVGVGVVDAALAGGVVTWGTPRIVTTVASTSVAIPVTSFAVDSASGALHVLFAPFPDMGSTTNLHVFHYRSLDGGLTWSAPAQLSATADSGRVSAPALAVGGPGVLQAAWVAPTPSGGPRAASGGVEPVALGAPARPGGAPAGGADPPQAAARLLHL